MSAAVPATIIDNDQIRVTTWTFDQDGVATGQHRHDFDYIVVPITGGTFSVTDADDSVHEMIQVAGMPYFHSAGVIHDVTDTSGQKAVFVDIELKR